MCELFPRLRTEKRIQTRASSCDSIDQKLMFESLRSNDGVDLFETATKTRYIQVSRILGFKIISDPTYLQHVTSSDLFVVSTMVASKFLFDDGTGKFSLIFLD